MKMPTKLSKAELTAGTLPPTESALLQAKAELDAAKAERKAARLAAQDCGVKTLAVDQSPYDGLIDRGGMDCQITHYPAEVNKSPKERKTQTTEAQAKIYGALEVGYSLTARLDGCPALRLTVVKVNKASVILCENGTALQFRLTLRDGATCLTRDGKAVEVVGLRYKAPKDSVSGDVAVVAATNGVTPKSVTEAIDKAATKVIAKRKGKRAPKAQTELSLVSAGESQKLAIQALQAAGVDFGKPENYDDTTRMVKRTADAIASGNKPAEAAHVYLMLHTIAN